MATTTTTTPGPWTLEAGRTFVTPHGTFHLAYGHDRHGNPTFRDYCALDANARLIAQAPAMLDALRTIADLAGQRGDDTSMDIEHLARAVLRAIEGKD